MDQIFHFCLHCTGLCGENHNSLLTFILGHNEIQVPLQYLKLKLKLRK